MTIANEPFQRDHATSKEQEEIPPELFARVLSVYKPHCRYLKKAFLEYQPVGAGVSLEQCEASIVAEGTFSLSESCYIDSTGHFNAVDFLICFNQLSNLMLARCTDLRLVKAMRSLDVGGYIERQLPNVLIVSTTSAFKTVIDPRSFTGRLTIDRSFVMRDKAFFDFRIAYTDGAGGLASGTKTVAIVLGERLAPKGG